MEKEIIDEGDEFVKADGHGPHTHTDKNGEEKGQGRFGVFSAENHPGEKNSAQASPEAVHGDQLC